ncbi:MAG TPA: L,D-transpeptidase [Acidimicrobiia bacterium]|nr:L,D-transpeptidase [Acidimicrobiia bacterium]
MRRLTVSVLVCAFLAACAGAGQYQPAPTTTSTMAVVTPSTTLTPSTTTPSTTAVERLDVESLPEGASLVLGARNVVPVFAEAGATEPLRTIEPTTLLGTTTVLTVLEGPQAGWARVMLPIRPNGSEGWVRTDGMAMFVVEGSMVIDLSDRTLIYRVGNNEVLTTEVGIGTNRNPTPTGRFFVTDSVTMANPDSTWGPHALGLSARSDTITEYNGGDGIIGIHGTNSPWSIGQASSLGCVRVPNEIITRLHQMVRLGTPVEIVA